MYEPRWTLQLTFKNDQGMSYHMALDIGHDIARTLQRIEPPPPAELGLATFSDVVTILKRQQFRKDLFVREATRLGHLLAERMEDKEGWHGMEREERLKDWGTP